MPYKPKLGISACLLGTKVRFDAGDPAQPRMIAEHTGRDWTAVLRDFAAERVEVLTSLDLAGYVLKKDSPSCGMERVRVYAPKAPPRRQGRGLFAAALLQRLPLMPVEEEGRLNDPVLRENFIERVFAYHRWQTLVRAPSVAALIDFNTRHKLLLLAHSENHYRRLGRMVAAAAKSSVARDIAHYGTTFMDGLSVQASVKKHANVLEHMTGYFSKRLTPGERKEMVEIIADFKRRLIPLVVPVTLVRHYTRKYGVKYLQEQFTWNPVRKSSCCETTPDHRRRSGELPERRKYERANPSIAE